MDPKDKPVPVSKEQAEEHGTDWPFDELDEDLADEGDGPDPEPKPIRRR